MPNVRTSWIPLDRHQRAPIQQSTGVFQSAIGSMMRRMMIAPLRHLFWDDMLTEFQPKRPLSNSNPNG